MKCRSRRALLCSLCLVVALTGAAVARAQVADGTDGPAQPGADVSRPIPLTNDTIIRMAKAGLDDQIIIQTIEAHPGAYYTTPDDLISLKQQGVSQAVIAAMQARSAGLAVHPPPTPVGVSPLAPGVDEIGVYYKDKNGQWQPLKTERVEYKTGGWLKSTVTYNVVKQDQNGEVLGAKSGLVLPTGVQILIYAPSGTAPEEYDLIRFREHSTDREFRVKTGGVFHSETGSQRDDIEFHPNRVAKDMYEFTIPVDIEKGEYGVLPPGSANTPGLSNAGKIYTFSIRE